VGVVLKTKEVELRFADAVSDTTMLHILYKCPSPKN